jgi:DNA helicase-2/ATP-dependent DNA helicase PcrA
MNEHRIHGPPGTGKTTTLAHWVTKAAERFGNDAVLVSSFTRAAAVEVASRGLPIESSNVGTLHALCYRALGRPKIAEDAIHEWNQFAPEYQLSRGAGGSKAPEDAGTFIPEQATEGDALSMESQTLRARMIPVEKWPERTRGFYERWMAWKRESGVMDFTDLIEVGLESMPRAPGNIAVGFFDEAQDLSPLELALARQWSRSMEYVVLVGDADQCIYTFKGSTPRAFLEPEIPAENNKVLAQSHRVPRAVHAKAREIIEQCSYRYPTTYLPRDSDGALVHSGASGRNYIQLADEIQNEPPFSSVMVLASCSFMLSNVVRELRYRGVPFHNPYRKTNGAWNPMRGGVERVRALLAPSKSGADRLWTWGELDMFVDPMSAKGVLKSGAKSVVAAYAKDRRTEKNNVSKSDLKALFEEQALDDLLACNGDLQLITWLDRKLLGSQRERFDYAFSIARHHGARRLFDDPSVVVGTIHSVKGAQADTVFMMPDLSNQGFEEWRQSGDRRDSVLRLMYVGMTRARETLVLCAPGGPLAADLD